HFQARAQGSGCDACQPPERSMGVAPLSEAGAEEDRSFELSNWGTPFLTSARDRQKHALACPGVDSIMCFGDVVQGHGIAGRYRQCSLACCGGEIDGSLTFRRAREVVAAEESDRQFGEEHGPEREVGPV